MNLHAGFHIVAMIFADARSAARAGGTILGEDARA
jgi:hypothetical protein